ncbi:MAG: amidohydrolase family protein [Puia sp.]|nr:amidohydrolase family protein [Puia sp.]
MATRKFSADHLFTGHGMAAEDTVLITDEAGVILALASTEEAGEGVESYSGILCPGFVNCHCHLELSHMRGLIPEKTGLIDFLLDVMKKRDFQADLVRDALAAAEKEMVRNGIVAVGDICNTTHSFSQKTEGNIYYHNFVEAMGFIGAGAPARFDAARKTFEAFAQAYPLPVESNSIVPHAPYSVSDELFGLIANFPGNHILTIHNQETPAEDAFSQSGGGDFLRLYEALGIDVSFFRGRGKRSLPGYLPFFYPNQSLILVHNVETTEEDLLFARQWRPAADGGPSLFFCLCPNANLYISGRLPAVDLLRKQDCTLVVGTDSLASNHVLSILEELKTLQAHFPEVPAGTLLRWATLNGAMALQAEDMLGSFEAGKQPGVILIEGCDGDRFMERATVQRLL